MGGSMLVLLWAGWKRDSDEHQRTIGWASIALVLVTGAAVWWSYGRFISSAAGPIAMPGPTIRRRDGTRGGATLR